MLNEQLERDRMKDDPAIEAVDWPSEDQGLIPNHATDYLSDPGQDR